MKSVPFSRGFNFSKWFESWTFKEINFSKFTENDFINAKSLGADVIRIPIVFHSYTLGDNDYTIIPGLLNYIDSAVDWAEKHGLYIMIDNHSYHPVNPTEPDVDKILIPVWQQLAERYKNRSNYVLYEVLNEPHDIDDKLWGRIQKDAIDAIRKIDKKHSIIVGGTNYNSIEKLFEIPEYEDDNLIYTFHYYDPHIFTHQGATWNNPSLAPLSGIAFPFDKSTIPEVHESLKGTWVEEAVNYYEVDSKPEKLYAALDRAHAFAKERGVALFCGEFGVHMIQCPEDSRVRWYEFTCRALEERNIPWLSWDYYGTFGLFKTPKYGSAFPDELNMELVKAMGLKA